MHVSTNYKFMLLIAWCDYSKAFMPEYELISRKYFKFGEKNAIFVRMNGDKAPQLSDNF